MAAATVRMTKRFMDIRLLSSCSDVRMVLKQKGEGRWEKGESIRY
jgi:hypothetical protein